MEKPKEMMESIWFCNQKLGVQVMKKKIRLNSIIFVAVTMVAVVALLSFWLVCNQKFFSMITERAVDDYSETTMAVQKNVETLISYTEDFSKYLSLDERVQSLMEEQIAALEAGRSRNDVEVRKEWDDISVRLIYSTSRLAGFGVYTEEKLLYSFYNSSTAYNTDIISSVDITRAHQMKSPQWTDLMILESTSGWYPKEEYVFCVLKYVQGDWGQHLGCIALFVKEASFADILTNTDDTKSRQFYLVNEDGKIVSAEDKDHLYKDALEVLELTESEYQICLNDGQMLLEPEGEAPILYMTSDIEGTQFRLVGRTVLQELQDQRKEFALFMQMTLFSSLAAAIVASWFVSKQVTRPIKQIITVMKQIEDSPNKEKLRCPVGGTEETRLLGEEFNRLMDKVDESAEQIYQEQRQRRHNEVRLLQAQIVPHFLYNTLGMISAFIKLNRHKEAQEAIQNLANFYRMSISGGNERISLREEMELTRSYLELQKMRYIEYVDYTMIHDEKAGGFVIPKLLIQPLVENVLNHGLKANGQKCVIIIETNYDSENDCCTILVSDTGQGMSEERLAQIRESLKNGSSLTKSVGLVNVYQRMKLIYGERFTMHVDSVEGEFTTFTLRIQGEADKSLGRDCDV